MRSLHAEACVLCMPDAGDLPRSNTLSNNVRQLMIYLTGYLLWKLENKFLDASSMMGLGGCWKVSQINGRIVTE